MMISKQDVMEVAGSLQVGAGQEAGIEAKIQAVHGIFKDHTIEAAAENAINAINRKAMLHNISVICPIISTYISNCYNTVARLFIIGGNYTRGSNSDGSFVLGVTPLIQHLREMTSSNKLYSKEIAYIDGSTAAGSI